MAARTVLLVDDEREFVNTLAERMSLRMMKPAIAYSGEEALEMVRLMPPDVMVLDLKMPGIGGVDVLLKIKKFYPAVNVIILTGHGDEGDRERLETMGASGYLQKPVDIDILVRTINNVNLL